MEEKNVLKIRFGFADRMENFQGQEGIGLNNETLLVYGDFYGIINFSGEDYVVAKAVEDESNNCPDLIDKYIVRPATLHQYNDGSEELVLNQEENDQCKLLEEIFNNSKENITSKTDIIELYSTIEDGSFSVDSLALGNEISATSISDEAFKREVEEMKKRSRQL